MPKPTEPTERKGTMISFEVDDPFQFMRDLDMLHGGVALLHGMISLLDGLDDGSSITLSADAFLNAPKLTEQLTGFLAIDNMARLRKAVDQAWRDQADAEIAARNAAREGGAR